jgi:hypothetical protein
VVSAWRLAVLFYDNTPALRLGLVAYMAFYFYQYRELVLSGVGARGDRAPARIPLRSSAPMSRNMNA